MITNSRELQRFETEQIRKEKADVKRNFRIVDALYREAVELGVFPLKNPLEGLETAVKIAKVVNSVSEAAFTDSPGIT